MNLKQKQWIDGNIGRIIAAINVVLVRGLGILLRRDHSINKPPENILIIKMLGIGSMFIATDSIYSLKKKYPNAKFILMTSSSVAASMHPLQLFDEIWVHNDKNFIKLFVSGFELLLKTWKLKKLWVVDLEVYSVLSTIFSTYTLAINRFGFQLNKVHFRNYLNTHNIFFNQFTSVYLNYEMLVKAMGVSEITPFIFEPLLINDKQKNTIAINNTCSELGGNLKKIPGATLQQLCLYIINNTNYNLAFTGAPVDFESNELFINNFLHQYKNRITNIAGVFNFDKYYEFLYNNCKAMISIDSAPMHIAIKLGLPTLSFWGPVNPTQMLSANQVSKQLHIYLGVHCSPCIHLTDVVPCGGNNICMKNMNNELIEFYLNKLLDIIKV
ncbi:MAG: glycosyltransferase family 9 protein [Bacteroidia bacterium]